VLPDSVQQIKDQIAVVNARIQDLQTQLQAQRDLKAALQAALQEMRQAAAAIGVTVP
jgi:septal ring factor EnvC (AmiA/AmiB activator)